MRAIKENAYAKINLFLDVVGKRDDGYHNINTVMHSLSLFDTVTVCIVPAKESSVSLRVVGNDRLVTDEKNLAVAAAKMYLERAAITAQVKIKLEKRIPVAAGLAGGSTDAAATLRAMNRLFDRYFSERALLKIAFELGSDVPYCLLGSTALCSGRGEIITRLPDLNLHAVIAVTGEYVSTPKAYKALDEIYSDFDGSVKSGGEKMFDDMILSLKNGKLAYDCVYNVFEEASFKICKKAAALKEKMKSLGALSSAMSGSGPSVFGIFGSESSARAAVEALKKDGVCAYYAVSV